MLLLSRVNMSSALHCSGCHITGGVIYFSAIDFSFFLQHTFLQPWISFAPSYYLPFSFIARSVSEERKKEAAFVLQIVVVSHQPDLLQSSLLNYKLATME